MGKRSATVIDAVQAMYAIDDRTNESWLRDVLASLHGCVPGTIGGFAYTYDIAGAPQSWTISRPIVHEAPASMADHIYQAFVEATPTERMNVLPRLGPSGTFSAVTGRLLSAFGEREASSLGVLDAVHVNALDADDRGVLVSLTTPARRQLRPAERTRLAMFAAHLAGARRWREAARASEPEVRFEANGTVAHVEHGHEAHVGRLRARWARLAQAKAAGASPDDVLAAWSALVDGRYTVVDRFDTDGRRYIVAYENPPNVRDPRGLTRTEAAVASWARRGHAQKLIAYELGLSLGTVSGLLGRVFAKLGVRTRAELVERLEEATVATRVAVGATSVLVFAKDTIELYLGPPGMLTMTERDVAERAVRGESNAHIATARGSSVSTVTNQLSTVFRKLGVASRAELVVHAQRGARQP
jgi:DNA-binding CsgD family transcriptional regulator